MLFKQFTAVFKNSFSICTGDPFFLVMKLSMLVFMLLASSMPSLGRGEALRLIRDQTHSIIFISGALVVVFGLIRVVTDDIRRGAGSILMSRPISGFVLLSGKLAGVLASVGLLFISGAAAYLWLTELQYGAEMNISSLVIYILVIVFALLAGSARQYMFGTNFSKYSSCALSVLFVIGLSFRYLAGDKTQFDLVGLPSIALLFFAMIAFASVVLVLAVVFDSALVLAGSIIVFFGGLLAKYFFENVIGGSLGDAFASLVPNWQIFWVLEKLGVGDVVTLAYCLQCAAQSLLLATFYLVIAIILFERTEIKGVA
jgi:hypothetical protein